MSDCLRTEEREGQERSARKGNIGEMEMLVMLVATMVSYVNTCQILSKLLLKYLPFIVNYTSMKLLIKTLLVTQVIFSEFNFSPLNVYLSHFDSTCLESNLVSLNQLEPQRTDIYYSVCPSPLYCSCNRIFLLLVNCSIFGTKTSF